MNLTAAQNDALAAVFAENEVGKFDGHILLAILAFLEKFAPFFLPFILAKLPPEIVAEYETRKVTGTLAATEELSAFDLAKFWAFIWKIAPLIMEYIRDSLTPIPDPGPGPVAAGQAATDAATE